MTTFDTPPDAQPTTYHRGQIFELNTGVTVCLVRSMCGDAWESCIVKSTQPRYPVGGYNIVVTDEEITSEGLELTVAHSSKVVPS